MAEELKVGAIQLLVSDHSIISEHLEIGEKCVQSICYIDQFEQVNDNFIVRLNMDENYVCIFDNFEKEIAFDTSKRFIVDLDKNIILYDFNKENSLEFIDLNGKFIRFEHFSQSLKGKEFMVDSILNKF